MNLKINEKRSSLNWNIPLMYYKSYLETFSKITGSLLKLILINSSLIFKNEILYGISKYKKKKRKEQKKKDFFEILGDLEETIVYFRSWLIAHYLKLKDICLLLQYSSLHFHIQRSEVYKIPYNGIVLVSSHLDLQL